MTVKIFKTENANDKFDYIVQQIKSIPDNGHEEISNLFCVLNCCELPEEIQKSIKIRWENHSRNTTIIQTLAFVQKLVNQFEI